MSCRRPDSACCARNVSGPSRAEELGLTARRPSIDSMFPTRRPIHHHIRTSVRDKATPKWYRAVRVKNLTGWSEGNAAYTLWALRRSKTERGFHSDQSRGKCRVAAQRKKRPRRGRRRFGEVQNAARKSRIAKAWKRAAEARFARVLPPPASPERFLPPP